MLTYADVCVGCVRGVAWPKLNAASALTPCARFENLPLSLIIKKKIISSWHLLTKFIYVCMHVRSVNDTHTHTHTHTLTNVFHFTRMFHTHIRVKGGGSCRVGTSFTRSVLLGGSRGTCTARPVDNAIHESSDTHLRVTCVPQ
jgi:hypothetical protein